MSKDRLEESLQALRRLQKEAEAVINGPDAQLSRPKLASAKRSYT